MKTLTKKFAQLTLALALTVGCSLGAQAASLEDVTFGKSIPQILTESKTAKIASMACLDERNCLIIDPHIDPVLGQEVNMVKYALNINGLYNVEIHFQSNNVDDYAKLVERFKAAYGKGEEKDEVLGNNEAVVKHCIWKSDEKAVMIGYIENTALNYKRFYMNIAAAKPGVSVVKDFETVL